MGFQPPTSALFIAIDILQVLSMLILVEVLVSWAIMLRVRGLSSYHPWVRTLHRITDPMLNPLRRALPPHRTSGWDLSPVIALIAIQILQQILANVAFGH